MRWERDGRFSWEQDKEILKKKSYPCRRKGPVEAYVIITSIYAFNKYQKGQYMRLFSFSVMEDDSPSLANFKFCWFT